MSLPLLTLSQGQLNLLETCPRKFQYIFNDSLSVPALPEQQASALWGNQFHLLMQQQALGLPIEVMAAADLEMMASVNALRQAAPDLFERDDTGLRLSESQRTLEFNGYLLTVIYDLLVLTLHQGQIVDWKTYLKPPKRDWLAKDWQTRLYLYALVETSPLAPEQVSLTYWFVRNRDRQTQALKPESYRFSYSDTLHNQTHQDLLNLTQRLTALRQTGTDFPKIDLAKGICERCPFAIRCHRLVGHEEMATTAGIRTAQTEPTLTGQFAASLNQQLATNLSLDAIDEVAI